MIVHIITFSLFSTTATWSLNGNGSWNVNGNWTPATFPNAIDDIANFTTAISANRIVSLGAAAQNITVGTVTFDDNNNYTVQSGFAGNTLIFDVSAGTANITLTNINGSGAHAITCPTTLNDTLTMSHLSTANFTISGRISGGAGLVKVGSGTGALILSNTTNNYSGPTLINAGNLNYGANGAIPSTSPVTIGQGIGTSAVLRTTAAMTAVNALSITNNSDGSLIQNSGATTYIASLQGSGNITITTGTASTNLFNLNVSTPVSYAGTIGGGAASSSTDPAAGNRFIKVGTSTLTLAVPNSYITRTFIADGVILVQNDLGLGLSGSTSGVYIRSSGANVGSLYIDNNITLNKALFLNGAGFSTTGALRNLTGTNTISGNIAIGWSGGTEVASDVTAQIDGTSLTLTGILSGARNLTKTGAGTLIIAGTGSNTLTGTLNVDQGTVQLNKTSGLNAFAGNVTINPGGILLLSATNQIPSTSTVTLAGGEFNLAGNADTIGSLVYNSGTLTQASAILSLASTATTALTLGDGISVTGNLAYSAAGGLTYTGTTNRAVLEGNLNFGTTTHIFDIADGSDSYDLEIQGIISDTGGMTKSTGTGSILFSGGNANTYTGTTTINAGALHLGKSNVTALASAAIALNGGTLYLEAADQISNTSVLTLSGGTFNMQGYDETISRLVFNSGTLTQGGALLSLANTSSTASITLGNGVSIAEDVALISASGSGGITYNGTTTTATISGNIDLGSPIRTFNIGAGAATPDLEISGAITGSGGINKTGGLGRLDLTGTQSNTFTGTTTVSFGTLYLAKTSGYALTGNIIFNDTSGFLELGGSDQIAPTSNMTLTSGNFYMNGFNATMNSLTYNSGIFDQGGGILSLAATSGNALVMRNVTISGDVMLTGGGAINFDNPFNGTAILSGTLDLGGFNTNFNIEMGTAGTDMLISGTISNGNVIKVGSGLLEFNGGTANTNIALTTVTSGTLLLNKTPTVNAVPGNITINGGTLQWGASDQIDDSATMTFTSGTLNLAGFSETIDNLIFNGGTMLPTGGTLNLLNASVALDMENSTITENIVLVNSGGISYTDTSGTAVISSTIDLGVGTSIFNINNGSTTIDMNVSGVISSNGSLTKIGLGRLDFTGTSPNLYTGLTTISAGILALGKTAGINAISGNVLIDGGTLLFLASNQITDTAEVTLLAGELNLASFAETIGTLNFYGGTYSPGSSVINLADGTIALRMRNTTLSASAVLTGGGAVVFDNTNNGTATISGNLDLSNSNTPFDIADGTAATDMLISGIISNGGLTKTGAGLLHLTGSNTYSNGTTISAGTLMGNTTSLQGDITDNANLIFDQTSAGTYDGILSGTGTFTKQGSGHLTLSNINPISGSVTVSAGTLTINGALNGNGSLSVNSGATLKGTGTISKDCTISGTLAPGNSIGTIHLVGDQTFATGSTLEVEFNPSSSDLVNIIGTLTIEPGTTLKLLPEIASYPIRFSYPIIQTTGGITGTFSQITTSLPLFTHSVTYSSLDATLNLETIFTPFTDLIKNGNARAVAKCLVALEESPCGNLIDVTDNLHTLPSVDALREALLQLQPSAFTSLAVVEQNAVLYIKSTLYNRLERALHSCCNDSLEKKLAATIWFTALDAHTSQINHGEEPGFIANSPGLFLGFDKRISERFCIGTGLGYTHSHLHWRKNRGTANIESAYGSAYGSYLNSKGYILSSLILGYNHYATKRHIEFGNYLPIDTNAQGHHSGMEASIHTKMGLKYGCIGLVISPFASIDYVFLYENSFQETGAKSLNLKVDNKNSDFLASEGGFDISYCFNRNKERYIPYLTFSAIRESRFFGQKEKASFECGCHFDVDGYYPSRTLGAVTAGINAELFRSTFSLSYQGKFASGYGNNAIYLQYILTF